MAACGVPCTGYQWLSAVSPVLVINGCLQSPVLVISGYMWCPLCWLSVAVKPRSHLDLCQSTVGRKGEDGSRCPPSPVSISSGIHFLLLTFPGCSLVEECEHPRDWRIMNSRLARESCPSCTPALCQPSGPELSSGTRGWPGRGARLWVFICIHQSKAEMKSQGSPQPCGGQDSVLSFW